jgi:hypothetical protein
LFLYDLPKMFAARDLWSRAVNEIREEQTLDAGWSRLDNGWPLRGCSAYFAWDIECAESVARMGH